MFVGYMTTCRIYFHIFQKILNMIYEICKQRDSLGSQIEFLAFHSIYSNKFSFWSLHPDHKLTFVIELKNIHLTLKIVVENIPH
jgi:hypothetical protein